jgi:hypothetical protein
LQNPAAAGSGLSNWIEENNLQKPLTFKKLLALDLWPLFFGCKIHGAPYFIPLCFFHKIRAGN